MEKDFSSAPWQITKAVGLSLAFAATCVLLISIFSGLFGLSQTVITVISSAVKAASILFGVAACVREDKGILKGAATGVLFSLLSRLLFCAVCGSFGTWWVAILELVLGGVWGAVCGIFSVNIKRK